MALLGTVGREAHHLDTSSALHVHRFSNYDRRTSYVPRLTLSPTTGECVGRPCDNQYTS
jgi:hypothetical protein